MTAKVTGKTRLQRFAYFFPFQLFMLHLQRSHFVLLFWILLFLFITQQFATKFGVPYLFLAPEYQGVVGPWSFGLLGFSLGGFIMAFNIYTYIEHAKRFPFLGTLSRPFFKFCVNNSIIPLIFVAVYIYTSSTFLMDAELKTPAETAGYMLAFVLGNSLFIFIALLYFFPTNKNIFKITGVTESEIDAHMRNRRNGLRRKERSDISETQKERWKVATYFTHPFKISLARPTDHYDREMLRQVFVQNHINASLFEIIVVIVFFIVGAFQFNSIFIIPAAASACLVFTVILMSVSILMSWTKSWTFALLFLLIFIVNAASSRYDILNMANYAYGLDYTPPPVAYTNATIDSLNSNMTRVRQDTRAHQKVLDNWLTMQREKRGDRNYKPVMVIVNTSGGGLRSSLWTVRTLQYGDSITGGALFENTRLISGSSGGTIGAAYYRELYLLRDSLETDICSPKHGDHISKDILNRVLFSLATNDIFIRFRQREVGGVNYVLDRGMTFESQLNANTGFVFDKPISALRDPVRNAEIPMMVLAPSVVNDGRRLLISSQPISYLTYEYPELKKQLNLAYENIEFNRLFSDHDADKLLLSSALRMNATFPYVLPYASLPTEPRIEVMDAGLRDNFGTKISVQYIYTFKDWIEKNTSGVVFLQIRDTEKNTEPLGSNPTIIDKLLNPIGSFYGNYFNDQDYNMDQLMKMTETSFDVPIYQLPLEIKYNPGEHIALSWHLTALEKGKVLRSINQPSNMASFQRLRTLLER